LSSRGRGLFAATTDGDLETRIKEQGDKVRQLKADKAAKEDIAAEVDKLLALKAEAEKASAPPVEEERKIGDAPQRVSDFGPLALAPGRMKVHEIMKSGDEVLGKEVIVKGWVRTVRDQKAFAFIELNDGSLPKGIQIVAQSDIESFSEVQKLTTGAAIAVKGVLVESQGKGQKYELQASVVQLVGDCSGKDYPLQKKRHSLEFLRTIAHLRPRSNTFGSVSRVRSALAQGTHNFFQKEGFLYLQSPIITASDCEGAGEMFRVTTIPGNVKEIKTTKAGEIDFSEDFFGKPAYLTVSGQLSGEAYATALGDIYTFGPTFRAENSQTTRHLAEFWMIEPEMAFADLAAVQANAEGYVKHVVKHVLDTCPDDMRFFNDMYDKTLLERLNALVNVPFARVTYAEAVELLKEEISKDRSKWQFPDVDFGTDLSTEHERWLAETKFKAPTFVYNYPRAIKSFYMRDNDDGKTVAATDLLVPGIGELVGGSQREERYDVLVDKLNEFGLSEKDYWWYLDLRRFGSTPHAGYGLGFERLVCYVTGMENIRDAIAFPRYPGTADF
jgi:asparaginyl-tRNA synthetase